MNARIMRWMTPGLVVLGLVGLGLTACGGPAISGPASPASAKADVANPCALTTPSAVAAAFGGTVANGKVIPDVVGKACWYQVTASNLGVSGHILVTPVTADPGEQTTGVATGRPGRPGRRPRGSAA